MKFAQNQSSEITKLLKWVLGNIESQNRFHEKFGGRSTLSSFN